MKKRIVLLACMALCLCFSGCKAKESTKKITMEDKYTNTDFAMGTVITQTLYGTPSETEDSGKEIIKQLKKVENENLSWRIEGSEIYKINQGTTVKVSDKTSNWIKQSLQITRDSDGGLDISIGMLTRLWDIGGDNEKVPTQKEINQVLNTIDYKKIVQNENVISVQKQGLQVDLGAIGKGIGSDEAYEILKKNKNIVGGIVAVGGSICVYGQKPDKSDWKVAVQNPRGEDGDTMGYVTTKGNTFVSTSGDYEKYIMKNGKRYHHILNGKTGYPAESGLISVTIVSDSGLNTDALSTACFVLGKEKSKALLKKYNAKAVFIDNKYHVSTYGDIDFTIVNDKYKK